MIKLSDELNKKITLLSRAVLDVLYNDFSPSRKYSESFTLKIINELRSPSKKYKDIDDFMYGMAELLSKDDDFMKESIKNDILVKPNRRIFKYRLLAILKDSNREIPNIPKDQLEEIESLGYLGQEDETKNIGPFEIESLDREFHKGSMSGNMYEMRNATPKDIEEMRKKGSLCLPKMTLGITDNFLFITEIIYDVESVIPGISDNDDEED